MLSFRLKYRIWQNARIWDQVIISDWGKIHGWITLVANLIYCHFHLLGLFICKPPHTHIIVDYPAHPSEFFMLLFLNEKAVEPRDRSRVRERVFILTLYWKLLLYGVPCIMTCHTHWEEALSTFLVTLLQELHYSCCHIYITLYPDRDRNDNSYTHPLIQA